MKNYVVRLTDKERKSCEDAIDRLKGSSRKACRARILVQVDADRPGWTDRQVAEAFRCRVQTVENVRRRCVLEGFNLDLCGKQRSAQPVPKLLDGKQEARVIALRLSAPPAGFGSWSLRLLARHVVEVGIVAAISHETVRQTQQNGITGRKVQHWVIPPEADAEFAAHMEDVLETYERPCDP